MFKEFISFLKFYKLYFLIFILFFNIISFVIIKNYLSSGLDNKSIKVILEAVIYPIDEEEEILYLYNANKSSVDININDYPNFRKLLDKTHKRLISIFNNNQNDFEDFKIINYKFKYEGQIGIWLWFGLNEKNFNLPDEQLSVFLEKKIFNIFKNEIDAEMSYFNVILSLLNKEKEYVENYLKLLTSFPECEKKESMDFEYLLFCYEIIQKNYLYKNQKIIQKNKIENINYLLDYIEKRIEFYKKNNLLKLKLISKNDKANVRSSIIILSTLISIFLSFVILISFFLFRLIRKK